MDAVTLQQDALKLRRYEKLGPFEIKDFLARNHVPYQWLDIETNEPAGWDYDAINDICERLNCVPVYQTFAWEPMIQAVADGQFDVAADGITINDERAEVVDFSEPYFLSGSLLMVPGDSSIKGVEDLAGKTVAVIQGSVQDTIVEELAPEAERVKFGKVSEAVLALKTGRADAYVHDDIVILTLSKENPDLKPEAGSPF